MNAITLPLLGFLGLVVAGCEVARPARALPGGSQGIIAEKEAPEQRAGSLFPSDQAVLGDEAVERALSTKLELPAKPRIAVLRFPDPGRIYWQDEDYIKLREAQVESISKALLNSEQVSDCIIVPSLMTPVRASIPVLREAAVRMQADLLLVFRIRGESYAKFRAFAKDKAKAYGTCELVVLDIRTGLVPFTRVVTREKVELQQASDLSLFETQRRAEEGAASEALHTAGEDLVSFLRSAPRKRG